MPQSPLLGQPIQLAQFAQGAPASGVTVIDNGDHFDGSNLEEILEEIAAGGLTSWKPPVRVATTTAGTLATSFEAGDTIDGVVLAEFDRILIKDQAAPEENGIYVVQAVGTPDRASDMDAASEVVGSVVYVREGTANAQSIWANTNLTEPVIDTDAITWAEFQAVVGGGLDSITDGVTTVAPVSALTVPLGGVADSGGEVAALRFLTNRYGGQHTVIADAAVTTTKTIDCSAGSVFDFTLTGNTTFTISNPPPIQGTIYVVLRQGGAGSKTVTWPASVKWQNPTTGANDGSAPTLFTAVGSLNVISLSTVDGGTSWGGANESAFVSFATPAIVLGTAAAAGSAATVIRSDATILAFDATVPAGLGVASVGVATVAARRDHVHPSTGLVGPILITDTPAGSPLVFADLLQTEAGDDLLYADV